LSNLPRLIRWCLTSLIAALFANATLLAAQTTIVVRHAGPDSARVDDNRNQYYIALLSRALSHSHKAYKVQLTVRDIGSTRQLKMLDEGSLDIVWNAYSEALNDHFTPIRVPLDKGLIGWRIFLINREDQPFFPAATTLDELKKIPVGQVYYWHDTDILKYNGFNTQGTPSYEGTFKMLRLERIRYFPRSIYEIWDEAKSHQELQLSIEKNLLLQYPVAYCFYVNKNNNILAEDITSGLEIMIKNGEFDALFEQYNRQYIDKADLAHRKIFVLDNPYLPADMKQKLNNMQFKLTTDKNH